MLEETFDLLFKDSLDLINKDEFSKAIPLLKNLLNSDNNKVVARANYHLGYVYSLYSNKEEEKNDRLAIMYLKNNLNSEYPQPYSYVLYSRVEKDKNIALNYLNIGNSKFPESMAIYSELFHLTKNKDKLVDTIIEKHLCDYSLLKEVIDYLFNTSGDWDKLVKIIMYVEVNNKLSEDDANYLNLIRAYSYLFRSIPDYNIAQQIFRRIIEYDIDNNLCYSPYLGIIYALIKAEKIEDAISYFDILPLNNSIQDLNDGPWCIIYLQFDMIYKEIFNCLFQVFTNNSEKKSKAKQLYALYLYSPSEVWNSFRYNRNNVRVLQAALKQEFNNIIARACFNMLCHFKEYIDANKILLLHYINNINPNQNDIFIQDITDNLSESDMKIVVQDTIEVITHQFIFDIEIYATTLFKALVNRLFKDKSYNMIISLAECLSDDVIINSDNAFKCAYSYANNNKNDSAKRLYEKIINKETSNDAVLNNLGVILENENKLTEAIEYYTKACNIDPDKEIYKNNLSRIKDKIRKQKETEIELIRNNVTLENLEQIGYTDELIDKFIKISNIKLRNILLRDLKECAISFITGQDKSAIVMCGSMIETLLLSETSKLTEKFYDISDIKPTSKKATKYPISQMGLNELLFVAWKEGLIQDGDYHLSHFIREYRNTVHPAKEIRTQQYITHDNATIVWTVLKQIIYGLLV